MLIMLIILVVALIIMTYLYIQSRRNAIIVANYFGKTMLGLNNDLDEAYKNYKALMQGRDEESEAYEQQFLSLHETIESQSTAIDGYIDDITFLVKYARRHLDYCLPNVGQDPESIARIERLEANIVVADG